MLYEFHRVENARKPNSVHATFYLTGRKRDTRHTNGTNGAIKAEDADTVMRSSPPRDSGSAAGEEGHITQTSVVIVREEELEAIKKEFEAITSIHIYSLESGPIEV